MIKTITLVLLSFMFSTYAVAVDSMLSVESAYPVKETADKFEAIIKEKGLSLFARIDHQKNAAGVNLALRPTELLIFGNPKVGTLLMQCSHRVAIDLPQKVLIWKDEKDTVWLSYNNPEYLRERHQIEGCDPVINKISKVLKALIQSVATK
jgi:uncharacterized protein (DUF302 family)